MVQVSERNFKALVLESTLPVWVVVAAPWSLPCQKAAEVMKYLYDREGETFLLAKVNADAEPELVQALGVQGLPAFLLFQNGEKKTAFFNEVTVETLGKALPF